MIHMNSNNCQYPDIYIHLQSSIHALLIKNNNIVETIICMTNLCALW